LEKHVRIIALEYDHIDVISGPLFLPLQEKDGSRWVKFKVIGPNDVAVPTHFFKVIKAVRNGSSEAWAYVVPNEPVPPKTPFEDFCYPLRDLEKVSGINFLELSSAP